MKKLTVRQVREYLPKLEELVSAEGELLVTRRGRPLARIVPFFRKREMPSHAALRASMPKLRAGSAVLVRRDRDER